jgi:FK506-binding protein 1
MEMSLGEKAMLHITSDYGYGASGVGPIPPNSDLDFEVELLQIGDQKAKSPGMCAGCIIV